MKIRADCLLLLSLSLILLGCRTVVILHELEAVKKDVAALVGQEHRRDPFEDRLRTLGFDIQYSPDRASGEGQLCLDDHCRHVFVVDYKIGLDGRVFEVTSIDVFASTSSR
jgi:hypothetical protein